MYKGQDNKHRREDISRRSRRKKIGHILNGNIDGDKEGEFTCTRVRGESIIDYALINTKTRGKTDKLVIEDRTELNYLPICVYLQLENEFKAAEDRLQHNIQIQQIWTEESVKKFRELLEDSEFDHT